MSTRLDHWPKWSEKAMQGLAFWIGHRHSLYRDHPLTEGALVAEACNLIYANLGADEILLCEEQYSRLTLNGSWPANFGPKARADLVIAANITNAQAASAKSLATHLVAVVEVKRASAPKSQIDQDLKRLATLKHNNLDVRALLFVVAEAHRPRRFVAPEGRAILGKHNITGVNAHYRVRRACKAAAAFSGKESAHYACVIEVFAD
ncbi:MAG: hypothetical protein O7D31_07595 [Alphaproteobacteria bacterium]|nr:hypothetical protein [Alphaproteobacteria bacterium]